MASTPAVVHPAKIYAESERRRALATEVRSRADQAFAELRTNLELNHFSESIRRLIRGE